MKRRHRWFAAATIIIGLLAATSASPAADEPGFKPLFDGRTLNGWQGEEGFWRVENGAIVGESTAERPLNHNTFLLWEQGELDDFELRLEFKLTGSDEGAANSGIQFRSGIKPDGHVFGYQADIDLAGNWVGACYDELGRGVLAKRGQKTLIAPDGQTKSEAAVDSAELLSHIHKGDWNEYFIRAEGSHLLLSVNGHTTAEIFDEQPDQRELAGVLALQLHSGPAQRVEFRNIRLKRLPLSGDRRKAVFVAGRPSHGWGAHEHYAGCVLLANALNSAARDHGLPVLATVYRHGWPKDPTAFDNANTIVCYCDGGGGHYVNERLEEVQHLMDQGIGMACIHYGVEVPKGPSGEAFLRWIGGYFEPHWSVNPHWTANFKSFAEHAITRGVQPFEINDEWYYHMRFPEGMEGVTPILTDLPPRETLSREDGPHSNNPFVREAVLQKMEPQHVAWAFERPDGKGRGFGFTGGHVHRNWQNDNFRKVVLNAIAWTAGAQVPSQGVESATPTEEQMDANQDEPKPGTAQDDRPQRRRQRDRAVAEREQGGAGDRVKPLYSSPVVTSSTPGRAVEIDVDITAAKSLFLVVTDGGDGFGCDWADWAEPRLAATRRGASDDAGAPDTNLTTLKWKSATSDWGQVRVNLNAEGRPLRIAGKPVEYGIGTHANSIIEFELPADHKFTRFKARAGLDNGGTDQGGGSTVQFHVFTERPGRAWLASVTSGAQSGASHDAADALSQLDVHPDLEATLFAAEPLLLNPTDIDIDHLGRVWVCEVVNYRRFANADKPERPEGDRILILEDTDGDGQADKGTTFYQGHDVDSAHGICVLPTPDGKGARTIVSCGDSVFFLIDDDGDLKADRKEVLFTGIAGTQHDHGIHAFVFGPDGMLYFNFGNAGQHIRDKDGKPIVDKAGNEVNDSRRPYQEGMVFRCNMDSSELETLGWNFRNNWEVAVDSFGTMWQSDNDDDGNRGVRINYVMEFGNFGYRDELTGAGWQTPRTGWEDDIPLRHWHQNDPGVIPNLLQTGAGSPTGICVYEGDLLPEVFRGALVHTDAGPNICRAYVTKPNGAGYTAEIVNILDGKRDQWFRPSDVCVAPDGSLIVADWYDPGVGGHRMGDVEHGRLFRVTPKGVGGKYTSPRLDVSSAEGAIAALQSPNLAARYMGWTALKAIGPKAEPELTEMYRSDHPRHRARALWLLGKLGLPRPKQEQLLAAALHDNDVNIQVTTVRLLRQVDREVLESVCDTLDSAKGLPVPVLREVLIGIRDVGDESDSGVWADVAQQYDGSDRWLLEALGIGASRHWDKYLAAYLETRGGNPRDKVARDIIWRSRSTQTATLLGGLIADPNTPDSELPRLFRAFDFQPEASKEAVILELALAPPAGSASRVTFIQSEAIARLKDVDLAAKPEYKAAVERVLAANAGTEQFVRLVGKFNVADRYDDLLALAQKNPEGQITIEAIKVLFDKQQRLAVRKELFGQNEELATATVTALATAADGRAVPLLLDLAADKDRPLALRRAGVKALGSIRPGAVALQESAQKGDYDPLLKEAVAATLHTVQWRDIKEQAARLFPLPPAKDSEPLPPVAELLERSGDVAKGRIVFHSTGTCTKCHVVNGLGQNVGPDLSEIGKKLSKPAFFESILYPSAAISHNYETWTVVDTNGNVTTGLLISETPDQIQLKDEKALVRTIKVGDIEERKKQEISLMPADIQKLMSAQELVDVVEYMTTLKQAQPVEKTGGN